MGRIHVQAIIFAVIVGAKGARKRHPLQFLHIPKNAGATIEHFFARLNHPPTHVARCKSAPWHTPPRFMTPNLYAANKTFCVVRDPLDRLVSEFKMIFRTASYETAVGRLNGWIYTKTKHTRAAMAADPLRMGNITDCHTLPQFAYVWDERGACTCDHLLRFESVEGDFDALMAAYDLPHRLEATTATRHHDPTTLSPADVSRSTAQAARAAYAEDYRLLFDGPCAALTRSPNGTCVDLDARLPAACRPPGREARRELDGG